jgi:hypothetical protein
MGKKKYPTPRTRKYWEKRDWSKLEIISMTKPISTDLAGTRSAYLWAKKRGFKIHIEKHDGVYLIWRIE